MIGVGKTLNKIYEQNVSGLSGRSVHKAGCIEKTDDFREFIALMKPMDVFTLHPGRYHNAFQAFRLDLYPKLAPKMVRSRIERLRLEQSRKLKVINQMAQRD